MALQIFSLIALVGAVVILIPTALRVFGKNADDQPGPAFGDDAGRDDIDRGDVDRGDRP